MSMGDGSIQMLSKSVTKHPSCHYIVEQYGGEKNDSESISRKKKERKIKNFMRHKVSCNMFNNLTRQVQACF